MPPPKAIVCHLCNGKYFKRSFPIHLKQCEAKWKKTHSRCQYCGSAVANHDWSDHRAHCKPTKHKLSKESRNMALEVPKADYQRSLPTLNNKTKISECEECETENASWKCIECEQSLCVMCEVDLHRKGSRLRHTRIPISCDALKQENLSVLTQNDCKETETELNPPSINAIQDHRTECKFCSRRFNPDRVEKHMRICAKRSKKKKRKIYDGAQKRIEGTVFEEYQYNRCKTPPKIKQWKQNGRRWRNESAQLREIATINSDLQNIRKVNNIKDNNSDIKDEENDIVIKAPANKAIFRKPISKPDRSRICSISKTSCIKSNKKRNVSLKGSSLKMKQRPPSNYSSKSSARNSVKKKHIAKREKNVNISNSNRMRRRYSDNKKASIPKFNQRKTVSNKNKMIVIEKDTEIKKAKPMIKRAKSEANSLARGIDLGVNVNKVFNDKPKTMNDYVERERLRRQRRVECNGNVMNKKSFNKPKEVNKVPTKKMSRLQIKKEIRIDNQQIGGKRINKPSNSKDLAAKRAAYFESLLQNED